MDTYRTGVLINLEELARNMSPPRWVWEMLEHYARTGSYRPEDLRRVLGDQTQSVEMGREQSARSHFNLNNGE